MQPLTQADAEPLKKAEEAADKKAKEAAAAAKKAEEAAAAVKRAEEAVAALERAVAIDRTVVRLAISLAEATTLSADAVAILLKQIHHSTATQEELEKSEATVVVASRL
jgi:hypothetical protein